MDPFDQNVWLTGGGGGGDGPGDSLAKCLEGARDATWGGFEHWDNKQATGWLITA